jgi:hypothetical protein
MDPEMIPFMDATEPEMLSFPNAFVVPPKHSESQNGSAMDPTVEWK